MNIGIHPEGCIVFGDRNACCVGFSLLSALRVLPDARLISVMEIVVAVSGVVDVDRSDLQFRLMIGNYCSNGRTAGPFQMQIDLRVLGEIECAFQVRVRLL